MNIALIGSGGREHALCKKIHQSNLVKKLDGHFMVMNLLVPKWSRKYLHD